MSEPIVEEFRRLERVFEASGGQLQIQPPASDSEINDLETKIGFPLSEDLKSLWRISNGSGAQQWFCGDDDIVDGEELVPCSPFQFYSVAEADERWSLFLPYGEKLYSDWHYDGSEGETDPRVQPTYLRHRKWLPFGSLPTASNTLYHDADPTPSGDVGQVIEFVHDPNRIVYKAAGFTEFFSRSNDLLELIAKAAPEDFEDEDFSLIEFLTE